MMAAAVTSETATECGPESRRRSQLSGARRIARMTGKEFGERFRSGWVLGLSGLWLAVICMASFFGQAQIGQLGMQGYERTVITLLNLVQYLVPLIGLLAAHDLVVGEAEDGTLRLALSTGISRGELLLAKLAGAGLAMCFPLALGFAISGTAIGANTGANGLAEFGRLAVSALGLGTVFVSAGLLISVLSRSRVQALVLALVTWIVAVFAFDLAALGMIVATQSPGAAEEIEAVCDPSTVPDVHTAFDDPIEPGGADGAEVAQAGFSWVLLNPVDLFRVMTLSERLGMVVPFWLAAALSTGWISGLLACAWIRFRRMDL